MPTKNCVDCGKEFYTRTTAVRCIECRTVHKKKLEKIRNLRNHEAWISNPENKEHHRQKVREYYQNNRDYYREYQRNYYQTKLKQKRKVAKLNSTVVEVDGKKLVLYECPRLKVKSAKLPCGERWECFDNGRCKLVPKGKEEITFKDAVMSVKVRPTP